MVLLAVTADTWIVTGLGFGIVLVLLFCLVYVLQFFGWIMQKATAPRAPKAEQPAPAPEKKRFDDSEFLRSWSEKTTVIAGDTQIQLPDISMETACEIDTRNSDGTVVKMGERKTGELAGMWKAYKNRLADPNANRDDVLMRLSAVNKILTARAKAQSDLDNL